MTRYNLTEMNIPFTVRPMVVDDVPQVMAVEKVSFSTPWSATAYRHELTQNELSHYIVVQQPTPAATSGGRAWLDRWLGRVSLQPATMIGYGGFWVLGQEAHISTIAVHPDWRGQGLGELLLISMIDLAATLDAQEVTLEVRVSNLVAQNLYRKYLFEETGRRRRYYRDNDEDALVMTTPAIDSPAFLETYRQRRTALAKRLRTLSTKNSKGEPHGAHQIRAQL
ncbi:MAG: ribosomal protein S18-alanine N-acetyltransferase [Chloroflexota bacterium]